MTPHRPKLLVVENDPDSLEAMAEILRGSGHVVMEARSGKEALRALESAAPPDLVILDRHLGDMSAEQVLARTSQTPRIARIPVALVSGSDDRLDCPQVVARLRKPFEPEALDALVLEMSRGACRG